ncbi:MAG: zinc-binding dehydrogenase [Verrucomicrobiota bacterium]
MNQQAITFTAPEQAELLTEAVDSKPLGPKEIAGRTLASVISAGTELAVYTGVASYAKMPTVPGYAAVFEAEEVGAEVNGIRRGDRLLSMGGHRSRQRTSVEQVMMVPANLDSEKAVFARLMGVSMSTLTTTTARPPGKVVVTGLGPVGNLAAQIFQNCGYEVTGCDPSESRRTLATQAGIKHVLPAVPTSEGQFADLVLECSGHEQAVVDGCRVVRKRGEVVLIGVPWQQRSEVSAHTLLHAVFHNYIVLRSGWEWELPPRTTEFRAGSIFANFAAALNWLADGRINIEGLYAVAPPRDVQAVYQDIRHNRTTRLATVFDWTKLS